MLSPLTTFCSTTSMVIPVRRTSWIFSKTSSTTLGLAPKVVDEEKLGPGHQTARDGQHLLFAAGESTRELLHALAQPREEHHLLFERLLHSGPSPWRVCSERKVFAHG